MYRRLEYNEYDATKTTRDDNPYLKRNDHNVIAVDYGKLASNSYLIVTMSAPRIADAVATALDEMKNSGFDTEKLHIVSHSMGSQISGYIGRKVSFQIPRITDFCSHHRSWRFYAESLTDESAFLGVHCSSLSDFTYGECNNNTRIVMGYATPTSVQGTVYLTTKDESPFGLDEKGIILPLSFALLTYTGYWRPVDLTSVKYWAYIVYSIAINFLLYSFTFCGLVDCFIIEDLETFIEKFSLFLSVLGVSCKVTNLTLRRNDRDYQPHRYAAEGHLRTQG
ncbi:hypothetical protein DBV15_08015 [Temnothorax longispinosus]|uniref:phospholipase A1 n=1 Tax=Temnothorax longispinosus TaxID=300112 RepID=A0A4S2L085_9HYME|nr:hypothetical protein DBV15_08015 [Temnothorax longispinosus]